MTYTPAILIAAMGVTQAVADLWAMPLSDAAHYGGCITPEQHANFLAQVGHESGGLTRLVESLNYTPAALMEKWRKRFPPDIAEKLGRTKSHAADQVAIAIRAYGGRMGNAPAPSTDGWDFRGRGAIQLTGRENYTKCGAAIKVDLVRNPDLVAQPQCGAMAAGWYWRANNIARLTDPTQVSAAVNTGNPASKPEHIHGLADRLARYAKALKALKGIK